MRNRAWKKSKGLLGDRHEERTSRYGQTRISEDRTSGYCRRGRLGVGDRAWRRAERQEDTGHWEDSGTAFRQDGSRASGAGTRGLGDGRYVELGVQCET